METTGMGEFSPRPLVCLEQADVNVLGKRFSQAFAQTLLPCNDSRVPLCSGPKRMGSCVMIVNGVTYNHAMN